MDTQSPNLPPTTPPQSSKPRWIALGSILAIAAIGAGAYFWLNRATTPSADVGITTPTTAPTAPAGDEVPPPNPAGNPPPATANGFSERPGIILEDAVAAMDSLGEAAKKAAEFNSGDRVNVTDRKAKEGEAKGYFYQVTVEGGKGWVDGKDLLVPEEFGFLDSFAISTAPVSELVRNTGAAEDETKWKTLGSAEFLLRCSHNPVVESSTPCIRRRLYQGGEQATIPTWFEMANDDKMTNKRPLNEELHQIFTTGVKNPQEFQKGFAALSDDFKVAVISTTCASLATSAEVFEALIPLAAKGSQTVFDSFAGCVQDTVYADKSLFADANKVLAKALKGKKNFTSTRAAALKPKAAAKKGKKR